VQKSLRITDLTWKALHTKRDKHHFYFWNFSKYKTWREKVGGHRILCPPPEKVRGTRPPCPPPICARGGVHDEMHHVLQTSWKMCRVCCSLFRCLHSHDLPWSCPHFSSALCISVLCNRVPILSQGPCTWSQMRFPETSESVSRTGHPADCLVGILFRVWSPHKC